MTKTKFGFLLGVLGTFSILTASQLFAGKGNGKGNGGGGVEDPGFVGSELIVDVAAGSSSSEWAYDVLVLADDSKVVGVQAANGSDVTVAKFQADGFRDPNFGQDGVFRHDLGDNEKVTNVLANGSGFVAVGYTVGANEFFAVGIDSNGQLDAGFGNNGVTLHAVNLLADFTDAVRDSSGGIVIFGRGGTSNGSDPDVTFVRLDPNGNIDPSFGISGVTQVDVGDANGAGGIDVQADGKLVAGFHNANGVGVIRVDTNGVLDAGFGTGGILQFVPTAGLDTAIRTLVLGSSIFLFGTSYSSVDHAYAAKITAGALDGGFGSGGISLISGTRDDSPRGVLVHNGNLLIAGFSRPIGSGCKADGATWEVDPATGNVLTTNVYDAGAADPCPPGRKDSPSTEIIYAMDHNSDGSLTLAGTTDDHGGRNNHRDVYLILE